MPVRNDFLCETCGRWEEFWTTTANPPLCCGTPMVWAPSRPPAVDAKEPFHEFDINANGKTYHIDSLRSMRKAERESEMMARDGRGQPLVWRDYSQDRSNHDVHTLARDLNKPITGYAGGATGVDGKKFKRGVGEQVTSLHGTADE